MAKKSNIEKMKEAKQFTNAEIWNAQVPGDFSGGKIDYLIYLREEKKTKEEIENGTLTLAKRRALTKKVAHNLRVCKD